MEEQSSHKNKTLVNCRDDLSAQGKNFSNIDEVLKALRDQSARTGLNIDVQNIMSFKIGVNQHE